MAILDDTRSDWNARPPLRPLDIIAWADRIGVSWHWLGDGDGGSPADSHQRCLDRVREWQRQHQAKNWKDIGYNALVCQHARAIEGRGLTAEGSHSPGVNEAHVGIQFMLGTKDPAPTAAMIARAQRLRYDIGQLGKNIRRDWAHRDDPAASTACPGDWIAKWVHDGNPTKYAAQEDDPMADITEDTVKAIFTTHAVLVDPVTGKRVAPSNVMETAARNSVAALAAVRGLETVVARLLANPGLTAEQILAAAREGANAAIDERIAEASVSLSVTQPQES